MARKVEGILKNTEGIEYSTVVLGYSLLTQSYSTNNAFIFVSLKPWEERSKTAKQLILQTNIAFRTTVSEATAIAFAPPPIEVLGRIARAVL